MKNAQLGHLLPVIRPQAKLDDAMRIQSLLRDRWIDYPRATQALGQLERLLATPRRERMPCLLVYGDSNIGKTYIPQVEDTIWREFRCQSGGRNAHLARRVA